MKNIIVLILLFQGMLLSAQDNKALISSNDSIISLHANIRLDHRIFGYEKPDVNSKKMLVLSVFTSDVEGNPYKCPFGAFYDTADMKMNLKYASNEGDFIKVILINNTETVATVYFDKYWFRWDNN